MEMSIFAEPGTPLILHGHIPKTGGTTLNAGFRKTFESFHLYHSHPDPFYILSRETLETVLEISPGLRSISSHHLRSFPLSIGDRPTFLVTFLRKPEDTFISQLRHVQRQFTSLSPEVRRQWPKDTPQLPLRELAWKYLERATAAHDFSPQTRFLCPPAAGARFGLSDGHGYGLDCYKMALNILTGFHFVGVVEEMKKSLQVLSDRLLDRGVRVYFDHDLKLNRCPETSKPAWLTPNDEVGRRVLEASKSDRLLHQHFLRQLLESHNELRKRRWLGFKPAAADVREALHISWANATRTLINSTSLYRSRRSHGKERPAHFALCSDLLEIRAAEAVAAAQLPEAVH